MCSTRVSFRLVLVGAPAELVEIDARLEAK